MTDNTAQTDPRIAAEGASTVAVGIPPDLARLPIVRATAATLAVSLDFDIDTMADLRMAVDEIATTAITRARPGSTVRMNFSAAGDTVTVQATSATVDAEPIDTASFGWMVLTTLAESVDSAIEMTDGGPELCLSLMMRTARGPK